MAQHTVIFDDEELVCIIRWAEKEIRSGTFLPDVQRAAGIKAKVGQAWSQQSTPQPEKTVQPR